MGIGMPWLGRECSQENTRKVWGLHAPMKGAHGGYYSRGGGGPQTISTKVKFKAGFSRWPRSTSVMFVRHEVVEFVGVPQSPDAIRHGDIERCHTVLVGGLAGQPPGCAASEGLRSATKTTRLEKLLQTRRGGRSTKAWKTFRNYFSSKCACEEQHANPRSQLAVQYRLQLSSACGVGVGNVGNWFELARRLPVPRSTLPHAHTCGAILASLSIVQCILPCSCVHVVCVCGGGSCGCGSQWTGAKPSRGCA